MKKILVREGVCLVHVCGEHILVATREARKDCPFAKYINDSAAYYFERIEQGDSVDQIVHEVSENCGVSLEQVQVILDEFIENLVKMGYLYIADEIEEAGNDNGAEVFIEHT